MNQILVVDFNIQKGHINFNKKILELLGKNGEITFLSSESYVKNIGFKNSMSLPDTMFSYKSKYVFVIKQIFLILHVIKHYVKKYRYEKVVILGYENMSFSLVWHIVKVPTYTFVHNNLSRGKLSLYFFRLISNNVSHILLSNSIIFYLEKKVSNKLFYLPHPINPNISNLNKILGRDNVIFSPSSSSNSIEIENFCEAIRNQSIYKFVGRSDEIINEDNIELKPYFDNFEILLQKASFIFISFNYNYRVSGVFYDSMTLNKPIIITNNSGAFLKEMAILYPNSVYLVSKFDQINEIEIDHYNKGKEHNIFINNHKDELLAEKLVNILKL